jgi:hypothetical protein
MLSSYPIELRVPYRVHTHTLSYNDRSYIRLAVKIDAPLILIFPDIEGVALDLL